MATAVILGCGYIGIELGRQLTAAGHEVTGVRRSASGCEAIKDAGLTAHQADLTDSGDLDGLPDADWVIFAASSGGRGAEAAREIYVDALGNAIDDYGSRASPPERFVYTSSTGVYGDHDGEWVDEKTPLEPTTEKTEVCGVDDPPKQTKAERLAESDLSETARRRVLTSKRCSNDYLRELGYELTYPTFREGYREAIEGYVAD